MDAAIVNSAHITPYAEIPAEERILCDDLLFNRDVDALPRFIAFYEEHGGTAKREEQADPTAGMTVDQRLHFQILHRKKEDIEALIDAAVACRVAGMAAEDAGATCGRPACPRPASQPTAGPPPPSCRPPRWRCSTACYCLP